jgi:hypothetical protein
MNVIHMPDKIALVTDGVLPATSLPKRKLAARVTSDDNPSSEQAGAEVSFDPPPASSEIRVSLRQGQDCMMSEAVSGPRPARRCAHAGYSLVPTRVPRGAAPLPTVIRR